MESFVPPIISRNAEPFNGWGIVSKLSGLFFCGHGIGERFCSFLYAVGLIKIFFHPCNSFPEYGFFVF